MLNTIMAYVCECSSYGCGLVFIDEDWEKARITIDYDDIGNRPNIYHPDCQNIPAGANSVTVDGHIIAYTFED